MAAPRPPRPAASRRPRGAAARAAPPPPASGPPGELLLDRAEDRLADAFGGLIKFWGFGPHAGRVWALLYLSPESLSAPQIARRLRMSAGSVSQTLRLLQRWGVVRRFRAPGRKLLLHTGTQDVWTSVARVLGEREAHMLRDLAELLRELVESAPAARAGGADPARLEHTERRLRALQRLVRAASALLEAFLAAGTLDLGPLRRVMRLVTGRGEP
jgi:DNA-binding transcriptional regulator GbsR (MarR family)